MHELREIHDIHEHEIHDTLLHFVEALIGRLHRSQQTGGLTLSGLLLPPEKGLM